MDYGPTTPGGESSVTISFSPAGVEYSWAYSIPDVTIHDEGDMSEGIAAWNHEIYYRSSASRYTYTVKPGVLVSVPKGHRQWENIELHSDISLMSSTEKLWSLHIVQSFGQDWDSFLTLSISFFSFLVFSYNVTLCIEFM